MTKHCLIHLASIIFLANVTPTLLQNFQAHACDNEYLIAKCDSNSVITVIGGDYRDSPPQSNLCHSSANRLRLQLVNANFSTKVLQASPDCVNFSENRTLAFRIQIEQNCLNKSQCKLLLTSESLYIVKDPCEKVLKYAELIYRCTNISNHTTIEASSNLEHGFISEWMSVIDFINRNQTQFLLVALISFGVAVISFLGIILCRIFRHRPKHSDLSFDRINFETNIQDQSVATIVAATGVGAPLLKRSTMASITSITYAPSLNYVDYSSFEELFFDDFELENLPETMITVD